MTSNAMSMASHRIRALAWLFVAVSLGWLLLGSAAYLGRPAYTDGHLWRISKSGVDDSYVLGTIHVADPRVTVIPGPVEDALAQSRTLATELVLRTVDEAELGAFEQLADHQRLETLIGAEAYADLKRKLAAQDMPEAVIEHLKPWAAMLRISSVALRGEEQNLDERLVSAARAHRLRVWSLEAAEEQVASFDTIPIDSQVALLRHALAHGDTLARAMEPAISAWLRGDLVALTQIANGIEEDYPDMGPHVRQLTQHIIRDRTLLMHHRLFIPLRGGRVFVAVGAAHLYGDDGLLTLLKDDGYRVTKIW